MASNTRYLHLLSPSIRAAILAYMADHPQDRPVYVASVIHFLGERGLTASRSELMLKNAIAEAAIRQGLTVGFGRPPLGLALTFYHPIRRALVKLRRIQGKGSDPEL